MVVGSWGLVLLYVGIGLYFIVGTKHAHVPKILKERNLLAFLQAVYEQIEKPAEIYMSQLASSSATAFNSQPEGKREKGQSKNNRLPL